MAGSTHKKVSIARFERETLEGYLNPATAFKGESVELATQSGSSIEVPYHDIKAICFVRDFGLADSWREHRTFAARPKSPGLWLRLRFRDGDSIEGVTPNNLLLVESIGFSIVPPDPTFQNQRIFVPRRALQDVQVLGVVGSPLKRASARKAPAKEEAQIGLFEQR